MGRQKKVSWLVNTFYWPWIIDIIIALVSSFVLLYFGYIALSDSKAFDQWASILSVFPLLYSVNNALSKINEDRKQKDNFERNIGPLIGDCQNLFEKHLPDSLSIIASIEKKIIDTHFDDWKKFQNIRQMEYQIIETFLHNIETATGIEDSDSLFLKYILITSAFPLHFSKLVSELKDGDYYTEGSPHNTFIRKIHEFTQSNTPLYKIDVPDIEQVTIEETINFTLNSNSSVINDLLQERADRQKVDYLLNKCFENAYSNAGDLNLELQDDDARKIIFLYKYDERFSILKRVLNEAIKNHFTVNAKEDENLDELISEAKTRLESLIYPLPFSKALADFEYCIEKLSPREKFAFVIYPEKFRGEAVGWTAQKFMADRVLPQAKTHQDEFNRKLVREFPFLKDHQKKALDANYYMFEFNRTNFSYHATQEAIPDTIKRFLIRDILDSDRAGDVVASQLIYLKQVINNLSISGLLFTEDKATQERIRKLEKRLLRSLKEQAIIIGNVYDLISIGNQFDVLVSTLHKLLHDVELKRKYGKKYDESKRVATTIINNAKEIVTVFNSLKASEFEKSEK